MLKHVVSVIALLVMLIPAAAGISAENGAEKMELNGGSRGKVLFPHRTHQTVLGDCNACHDLFPQEAGAIDRLKQAGNLKSKQVMNTGCIKCHRATQKQGRQAGPTTCSQCHFRG